jgi:uncharacterized protein (TIGR02118 family)
VIKLIVAIRRNPDMSPEQFHTYWRTVHAEKVRALPATARYIRRYVQAHTIDGEYNASEPSYDGTAELWFDSVVDKDAFYSDPEYLRVVRPDETVFADMANTRFFVTREETVAL